MNPETLQRQQRIALLYSGETFRSASSAWAQTLADHFQRLETRDSKVLNWSPPASSIPAARKPLLKQPASQSDADWLPEFTTLVETILANGQNLHHPRYIGHQVPASLPIAALFDAIGSATNQVMAIYEMGPWATAVERVMIETLGREIGFPEDDFSGLVTSGGSLANLTTLLTARNVAVGQSWQQGITDASRLALVVQQDVHYCVTRAAGILGIGTNQIVKIPVDDRRRMQVDALRQTLADLQSAGRTVVAVVAGACATPIGAFDPLNEVADACEEFGVWMHVDAAHGGAALLSDHHRHLLDGLHRADSIVWDAHKMLFMPALCAFAFYRNREHRFTAFQQDAPYLFDPSNPGMAEYDSGIQTIECTKRAAAFGLWGTWSLFGRQLFSDLVDVTFEMTHILHDKLCLAPDFMAVHQPQCNIQAFRYMPDEIANWSPEQQGEFQLEVRKRVIHGGSAYIVPIKLEGVGALRATVINPCTTPDDLDAMLDAVRCAGAELLSDR